MASARTKKVCLITPGHLASNPRLVKEAQALTAKGYAVSIVFTQYVNYLIDFDFAILANNPDWSYHVLDRTSKHTKIRLQNYAAALIHKICVMLLLQGKKSDFIFAHAINRYFYWQLKKATAAKADLYIAHNLAALPVAVLAAKKNKVKCGFDAEDFHRNETADDPKDADVLLKTFIEEKYISQTNYLTASSLPITHLYQKIFPARKITTVLNVFPVVKEAQVPVLKVNKPLKLVWFSQYIGLGRGLETIFEALNRVLEKDFELHLIGFLSAEMKQYLAKSSFPAAIRSKIIVHQPVHPDRLIPFINQFDIGLATENSYPLNRDICLTNKIFSYIQAGLAVLASDTKAQSQLFLKHPGIGKIYAKNSIAGLTETLNSFFSDPELIFACKKTAYKLSQTTLNWETESEKFLKVVAETLAD